MRRHLVACLVLLAGIAIITVADAADFRPGSISGKLMVGNKPMDNALVYFYNLATGPEPSKDRYWRVPDTAKLTDKDGTFSIDLLAGDYCVGAVKRSGPLMVGPPQEGDIFLLSLDDRGKLNKYQVKPGEKVDIGIVSHVKANPEPQDSKKLTIIEGVAMDLEGKPFEGALVLAFLMPTVMGKPLFVSDRSDKNGLFILRVHEGGTFYLKLRNSYGGGQPETGAVLDGNREEPLQRVYVKTGDVTKNVILKGKLFPGRGRKESGQLYKKMQ